MFHDFKVWKALTALQGASNTVCLSLCAFVFKYFIYITEFLDVATGKELICQCRRHYRPGFSGWVWKISGGGNGYPIQYSCLENPMDREGWRATVLRVAKRWTWLSMHHNIARQISLHYPIFTYKTQNLRIFVEILPLTF